MQNEFFFNQKFEVVKAYIWRRLSIPRRLQGSQEVLIKIQQPNSLYISLKLKLGAVGKKEKPGTALKFHNFQSLKTHRTCADFWRES